MVYFSLKQQVVSMQSCLLLKTLKEVIENSLNQNGFGSLSTFSKVRGHEGQADLGLEDLRPFEERQRRGRQELVDDKCCSQWNQRVITN